MRVLLVFVIFILLSTAAFAISSQVQASFKQEPAIITHALLQKDLKTLQAHVDLSFIINRKIKLYAQRAETKSLFSQIGGKLAGFSEPVITQALSRLAMAALNGSSLADRKYFTDNLHFNDVSAVGDVGMASGSFLGKPIFCSSTYENGRWVLAVVESPLIDQEIRNALKTLQVK